jgi:hypothetical protein
MAGHGLVRQSRRGKVWRGPARYSKAGGARLGVVRRGKEGQAWLGSARLGMAKQARLGR